jgi:hypothetical protein
MVLLVPRHRSPERFSGVLIDWNDDGFRVHHKHTGFKENELVGFFHRLREGTAHVVWSRNLGTENETGFSYVETHADPTCFESNDLL